MKTFNDPIHGHFDLSSLSVKIIDTPHFQRLRGLCQLGGVYWVFPGACANRFEHSLGVAYLARHFVNLIKANQPDLMISDVDVLCVEIAGLVHDLGHGPFSHLFDGKVLPTLRKTNPSMDAHFHHEHASIGIFQVLIDENDLMPEFRKYGLDEGDVHFIKELVLGDRSEGPVGFEWVGRGAKTFLYDIVANKRNGEQLCHVSRPGLTQREVKERAESRKKAGRTTRQKAGRLQIVSRWRAGKRAGREQIDSRWRAVERAGRE
jgi:hypothetical protein